jgi:hypothetical protein
MDEKCGLDLNHAGNDAQPTLSEGMGEAIRRRPTLSA